MWLFIFVRSQHKSYPNDSSSSWTHLRMDSFPSINHFYTFPFHFIHVSFISLQLAVGRALVPSGYLVLRLALSTRVIVCERAQARGLFGTASWRIFSKCWLIVAGSVRDKSSTPVMWSFPPLQRQVNEPRMNEPFDSTVWLYLYKSFHILQPSGRVPSSTGSVGCWDSECPYGCGYMTLPIFLSCLVVYSQSWHLVNKLTRFVYQFESINPSVKCAHGVARGGEQWAGFDSHSFDRRSAF